MAAGQHDVEQDAAEGAWERAPQRARARVGLRDAVAFFAERLGQKAPQIAIVFDEKDLHEANVRPAARGGQCEKDENALRIARATSLEMAVPSLSAHEHCTLTRAKPDSVSCARPGYSHLRRRLLLDDGARLRRSTRRDFGDLRIHGRQ